jgi:hypothetical protein
VTGHTGGRGGLAGHPGLRRGPNDMSWPSSNISDPTVLPIGGEPP